jgi:hypothetical protein
MAADAYDAEVGLESRERVVRDLGLRGGDARDERRLPGIGEADERYVGEKLQLEVEPAFLAHFALLGEAGRSQLVGEKARVAATTATTACCEETVSDVDEVREDVASERADESPFGDRHDKITTVATVALRPAAVRAVLGTAMWVVPEGQERHRGASRLDVDVTSRPGISAIGSSTRDVRLTPEGHRAGSTVPRFHVDLGLVDES